MRNRRGFTLLELIVALSVGALVITVAHRIVAGVTDGAAQLEAAVQAHDRDVAAVRLLTRLLGSAEVIDVAEDAFAGAPDRLAFPAWDVEAHGWPVRSDVRVWRDTGGTVWLARGTDALLLWHRTDDLTFDYLLTRGEAARWVRAWVSSASMPYAVRLRIQRAAVVDTLLLIVGDRG